MKTFNMPEGYILSEITNDGKVIFKRGDDIDKSKTWKEFCDRNNIYEGEAYIDSKGRVKTDFSMIPYRCAEPMLVLIQLLTIREMEYLPEGWDANGIFERYQKRFYIAPCSDGGWEISALTEGEEAMNVLTFPTEELAQQFFDTWERLIMVARPLLQCTM